MPTDQKYNINARVNHISHLPEFLTPSPACSELLFSVSSVPPAVAGVGSVKTESGLAETSVGPAAPSGEQVVSHVRVAAAEEPKKCWWKGEQKGASVGKNRERGQDR